MSQEIDKPLWLTSDPMFRGKHHRHEIFAIAGRTILLNNIEGNFSNAPMLQSDGLRSTQRQIKNPVLYEWSAIIDPHDDRLSIAQIRHLELCAKWKFPVGSCEPQGVVAFTVRREFSAFVIGSEPLRGLRRHGKQSKSSDYSNNELFQNTVPECDLAAP